MDAVLDLVGGEALADARAQVRDVSRIASIIDPDTVLVQGGRFVCVRPDGGKKSSFAPDPARASVTCGAGCRSSQSPEKSAARCDLRR